MLHWANKDQYYTKSGENFSNYSFKLEDGRTVHLRLAAADTAKDNRKDNDKERRFALVAAGGERARAYGVLPWAEHVASSAATRCFTDWLSARGGIEPGGDPPRTRPCPDSRALRRGAGRGRPGGYRRGGRSGPARRARHTALAAG